ncbi:hypothetical protein H8959_016654 [Pygathrix nigripes]
MVFPEDVLLWMLLIRFAIARHLAQDGAHMVVSGQKQQNMGWAVAALSVVGTVCHLGKAEDQEWLVVMILCVNVKASALLLSQLLPHVENRE